MIKIAPIFLFLMIFCGSLSGQEKKSVEATFEATMIELGEIERGAMIDTVFTFVNTGSDPLQIDIASGCECTTLDWTRGEIASGGIGKIFVHFDSSKKEKSEVIDVDIDFIQDDPETSGPYWVRLQYSYTFKEKE